MIKSRLIFFIIFLFCHILFGQSTSCDVQYLVEDKAHFSHKLVLLNGRGVLKLNRSKTVTLEINQSNLNLELNEVYNLEKAFFRKFVMSCKSRLNCLGSYSAKSKYQNYSRNLSQDVGPQTVDFFDGRLPLMKINHISNVHNIWIGDDFGITNPFTGLLLSCN